MRAALALLLGSALAAADAPPVVVGYDFANAAAIYDYHLHQEVAWHSADDQLTYSTDLRWRFAIDGSAASGPVQDVTATIVRVEALHRGPGTEHRLVAPVAPGDPASDQDPLLGHLAVLPGCTVTLRVDVATGVVQSVSGGQAIVARINRRHPAPIPGDPPPLAKAAEGLYSDAALTAWWSQLLALPSTTPQDVPLSAPLTGALRRTWTGNDYVLALPEGVPSLSVTLLAEPTPVAGTLAEVTGKGRVVPVAGLPDSAAGELAYTLSLSALTQGVVQRHTLTWTLERVNFRDGGQSSP